MSQMTTTNSKFTQDAFVESDESHDDVYSETLGPPLGSNFAKAVPPRFSRRESLLTRQLNGSEGESHTEDERHVSRLSMRRVQSASSNPSVASTAELTSDNDVASPGTRTSSASPPLPPTRIHGLIPIIQKPIAEEPAILGEDRDTPTSFKEPEAKVEAGLGRRRCITFACGNKETSPKPAEKPDAVSDVKESVISAAPKRKTAISFACPTGVQTMPKQSPELNRMKPPRPFSPGARSPRSPRSPRVMVRHAHRGSDSTIKSESPKVVRRVPSIKRRKYSEDMDDNNQEARHFHEFATVGNADEDWTREITCHRSRLTIKDTLHKENVIRQIGEEVEEEALDDEDNEDEEELLDDIDDEDDDEIDDDDEGEETEADAVDFDEAVVSDAGFDTDDEGGFDGSDADSDHSDFEWWAPGRSTAATSTDQLEHIRPSHQRTLSDSSLESSREANGLTQKPQPKMKRKSHAVNINRPVTPDLPDSTDFVCGTLDEDRPMEQAYLNCMEQRKALKHKVTPQDIDPTFPTSDPEMDEEDEDDDDGKQQDDDDQPLFMHGQMELNEERGRGRADSTIAKKKKSPLRSPRRLHSPPPPSKKALHRSPPPPAKKQVHRSPPPVKRQAHRSPQIPAQHCQRLRSPPPPKRLFSQSPKRMRSPPPRQRITSPANSRRASIEDTPSRAGGIAPGVLGSRPQPTRTASLPRVPTAIRLQHAAMTTEDDAESGTYDIRTRGAIDIVKGLEKKRLRRKEKLYQKHCQKKNKEGEKKPKPGKGAQRMREVGLELAAYRGKKAEHMLSY